MAESELGFKVKSGFMICVWPAQDSASGCWRAPRRRSAMDGCVLLTFTGRADERQKEREKEAKEGFEKFLLMGRDPRVSN